MTAEASGRRRGSGAALLPVAVVVVALVIGVAAAARRADPGPGAAGAAPVRVEATPAVRHPTLGALVAASDVVVRGEVVAVARGRTVGGPASGADPAAGAVVSRLVSVRIDEVLAGRPGPEALAPGGQLVVEEEGWLTDGRAIALNGAAPPRQGDRGVWFLAALEDPDLPLFVTVNTQGRFLSRDGRALEGTDPDDPLVQAVERRTLDELGDAVRAVAAAR